MKMILRPLANLLVKINSNKTVFRYSALFVNGAKATENYLFVTPHLDYPENFKYKEVIKQELIKRKVNINFNKLEELWTVYEELKSKKSELENKKNEISKELSKLIKDDPDSDACKKLKLQSSLLKENIKKIKEPLWSAEEAAVIEALKLPNKLHPKTKCMDQVLHTHLFQPKNNKNHLKIGEELNLIEIKSDKSYYLKGEAAVFELGAEFFFSNSLKKNKFIQFSNPDFVKSVIIEGCGLNHTSSEASFILNHDDDTKVNPDSRLHLTGGGSLCSFLAYHAKHILYPKVFPLKYFSMGRQYSPSSSTDANLLNVSQSSVIEIFCAVKTEADVDTILNEVIYIMKDLYSRFGYHYRICLSSADKLAMWESLHVSIEMYSSSLDKYVEVGNVSVSGNFISKRLMFTYIENKESQYPHIISGTVLNVPKFLACILEQDQEFKVPHEFKVENWSL